jgi:hypothetical protein
LYFGSCRITLWFCCVGGKLWPKGRGEIFWPLSSKHLNAGFPDTSIDTSLFQIADWHEPISK